MSLSTRCMLLRRTAAAVLGRQSTGSSAYSSRLGMLSCLSHSAAPGVFTSSSLLLRTITSMSPESTTGKSASLNVDAQQQELGKPNQLDQARGGGQLLHTHPPPAGFEPLKQDYSLALKHAYDLAAEGARPLPRGEAGALSGAPADIYKRRVTILAPANSPTQQGAGRCIVRGIAPGWKIEKDVREKWVNPLMGWTSTADSLGDIDNAALWFHTREQAMAFAQKHGWEYEVLEPQQRRFERQKRFKGYGDNFTHKRGGIPDLSHLDQMPQLAQSGQQPGKPASAKDQIKTGGSGNISKTAA